MHKRNRLSVAIAHALDADHIAHDRKKAMAAKVEKRWKECIEETPEVRIGDIFRPKRANQHSKNIVVVGLEGTTVIYTKGDQRLEIHADDFLKLIGKRICSNTRAV